MIFFSVGSLPSGVPVHFFGRFSLGAVALRATVQRD